MKRSCRRAHHDRADFEWNLIGKRKCIRSGNFNELRVTAVAILPDHLHIAEKLFLAAFTKITASASDEIVNTNAISRRQVRDLRANFFHGAGDLVPKCQRQRINLRNTGAVVRVRVTDPGSCNANQNVGRSDLGNWNIRLLERFSDLPESHRSHFPMSATRALNGYSSFSTNERVQLRYIQTSLAIVLPSQLEKSESILVGSKTTVHRLVQIDEAAANHEQCNHWLW